MINIEVMPLEQENRNPLLPRHGINHPRLWHHCLAAPPPPMGHDLPRPTQRDLKMVDLRPSSPLFASISFSFFIFCPLLRVSGSPVPHSSVMQWLLRDVTSCIFFWHYWIFREFKVFPRLENSHDYFSRYHVSFKSIFPYDRCDMSNLDRNHKLRWWM